MHYIYRVQSNGNKVYYNGMLPNMGEHAISWSNDHIHPFRLEEFPKIKQALQKSSFKHQPHFIGTLSESGQEFPL
jgi:hypothetical protein